MLSAGERTILERNFAIILRNPHDVSQDLFAETYNTVYTHCTALSEEYSIKGDMVYELLAGSIDLFAARLEFPGSMAHLAEQVDIFRYSSELMTKAFSYLERFYIKTSLLRDLQVQKLKDLFYFKIYYNYIYKVEENMLDLIFLEIETFRKLYRQECDELKNVVTFYLELLVSTGQEGAMRGFFRRYVEDFRAHTSFSLEIGKLLKKVYLEVFFALNVLGDKEVCKEVIQMVAFRKDEIIEYVFAKIAAFEKFKHIYKIISMLPEAARNQFKCRYEEVLKQSFTRLNTFGEIYTMYSKAREQITVNKMNGYNEMLDGIVRRAFIEKKGADQVDIQTEMVCSIEKFIAGHSSKAGMRNPPLEIKVKIDVEANFDLASDDLSKKFASQSIGGNGKDAYIDPETYFDLFTLIFTEYLMDLYTERCQCRLLRGLSPVKEQMYTEMILQRVGWSAATKLKSSVSSFMGKYTLEIPAEGRELGSNSPMYSFAVSLAKITKGFWEVEKNEVNLHSSLEQAKLSASGLVRLAERQRLDFNFKLSPLVFELNRARYRVSSDAFSMYLHVLTADGIDLEQLRSVCCDRNFDSNVDFLVQNGFISYDGRFRAVNKKSDREFVDLFVVPQKIIPKEEAVCILEKSTHIIESKICSMMKKAKKMRKEDLAEGVGCEALDFETAFTGLVSKGFLEVRESKVIYIP